MTRRNIKFPLIFTFLLRVQIAAVALQIFMICTWCCACTFASVHAHESGRERQEKRGSVLHVLRVLCKFQYKRRESLKQIIVPYPSEISPGVWQRFASIDIPWKNYGICLLIALAKDRRASLRPPIYTVSNLSRLLRRRCRLNPGISLSSKAEKRDERDGDFASVWGPVREPNHLKIYRSST